MDKVAIKTSEIKTNPWRGSAAYVVLVLAVVALAVFLAFWQFTAGGSFLQSVFGLSTSGDTAAATVIGLAIFGAGMMVAHSNVTAARERARGRRRWAEDMAEVQGSEDVRWAKAFAAEIGVDLSRPTDVARDLERATEQRRLTP